MLNLAVQDLGSLYLQLLGYLSELDRLRAKPKQKVNEHEWAFRFENLPAHESIEFDRLTPNPESLLRVSRAEVPPPPTPPDELLPWLQGGFANPNEEPTYREELLPPGEEFPIPFEESDIRDGARAYLVSWQKWAEDAKPAKAARKLYDDLYHVHASMRREEDKYELVLADVVVRWGPVEHPLLIQPLELEFEAKEARFLISVSDSFTQVYGDAVRTLSDEAPTAITAARKEVAENPEIWAFAEDPTDDFAKRFIQAASTDGKLVTDPVASKEEPIVYRSPMLILRLRATGLAELIETLKEKFAKDGEVPEPIVPIIAEAETDPDTDPEEYVRFPDEDPATFFTQPANKEQLEILRTYRRRKHVLVQGPPGTGKTHTIGNLIGQFLAEGKTVLVTSQNPKALKVLRSYIVRNLRSLSVSLTGDGRANHEELSEAVQGLNSGLTRNPKVSLATSIQELERGRPEILADLKEARKDLETILSSERQVIEVLSVRKKPSEAAIYVANSQDEHGWIPGKVTPFAAVPLTDDEFALLYRLTAEVAPQDERSILSGLPPVEDLPTPSSFGLLHQQYSTLFTTPRISLKGQIKRDLSQKDSEKQLAEQIADIREALGEVIVNGEPWRLTLARQGDENPNVLQVWEARFQEARKLIEDSTAIQRDVDRYEFKLSQTVFLGDLEPPLKSLHEAASRSKKPILGPRLFKKADKTVFDNLTCGKNERLGSPESFALAIKYVALEKRRRSLMSEWEKRAAELGIQVPAGVRPEDHLARIEPNVRKALNWYRSTGVPVFHKLKKFGWDVDGWARHCPPDVKAQGHADALVHLLSKIALPMAEAAIGEARLLQAEHELKAMIEAVKKLGKKSDSKLLIDLAEAATKGEVEKYEDIYDEIARIKSVEKPVVERRQLLNKLRAFAPLWADAIEHRLEGHRGPVAPGSILDAWMWKQFAQELDRRHELSIDEVNDRILTHKGALEECNADLAFAKAWYAQHGRTTNEVTKALAAIHSAMKMFGKGQGKRALGAMRALKEGMRKAKDAFPVWIMPLYKVAQSFDFTKTKFDVVIVDEASQLDATGLVPLLIADTAIVVGDDEQVEPILPGIRHEDVVALIAEHLEGFPYKDLWRPEQSLYGFAGNFGTAIRLVEHFRCVPEVIAFSSKMCYHCQIQPLRDATSVKTVPAVVPVRVEDSERYGKQNEVEAEVLVSLMMAADEQPEYRGKSFGAIALKGDKTDQVAAIENLILRQGGKGWGSDRNFLVGTAPQFQGDERDVMFLSLVDAPREDGGPHYLEASDMTKKRFNVAVSRAKDQVWMVHSLELTTHLKPDDNRFKLLDFTYNSKRWHEEAIQTNPLAMSPFETEVYRMLAGEGYKVDSQYQVGGYWIDMVVTGEGGRVAIECDGEAFHQDVLKDMERQMVLERCGWNFARIRGSQFYRDKTSSFRVLLEKIKTHGVTPFRTEPTTDETEVSELQSRVLTRAQEIRQAWRTTSGKDSVQTEADLFDEEVRA